jgi:hypothetical protein
LTMILKMINIYYNGVIKIRCSNNRLDVNWTKTFFMVVTNKRLKIPE